MVRKISFYTERSSREDVTGGTMIPLKVKMKKTVLHTLFRAQRYAFFVITGICRGNSGFQIH